MEMKKLKTQKLSHKLKFENYKNFKKLWNIQKKIKLTQIVLKTIKNS